MEDLGVQVEKKEGPVLFTNACGHPGTVMVKGDDTAFALMAMLGPEGLVDHTDAAVPGFASLVLIEADSVFVLL